MNRWTRLISGLALLLLICTNLRFAGVHGHGRVQLALPPYVRGPSYQYFLSLEQRERGLGYLGSRRRLKAVVRKLLHGEQVHVTTIGGSVTAGLHGLGDGHSWPDYLFNFLNDTFPGQIVSTNGAVPGTISSYMSACVNIHVPKSTDLVLVEYTVNDVHPALPLFVNEYRRSYERLIRKLLNYPNHPAVILMHSYAWTAPPMGRFWSNLEREFYEFALYYDVPSLSLKAAAYHAMVVGKEGFSVERPRHDDPEGLAGKSFFLDTIHPDTLTGARAMAELAMHLVVNTRAQIEGAGDTSGAEGQAAGEDGDSAGRDSEAGGDAGGEDGDAGDVIPPPMLPGNYETMGDRCFIGTHFRSTIASADGFEWLNDSRGRAPKFGYISKTPGSVLRIRIDTRASSSESGGAPLPAASAPAPTLAEPAAGTDGQTDEQKAGTEEEADDGAEASSSDGEDEAGAERRQVARRLHGGHASPMAEYVLVQIVHLKSYEGMGTAQVTCEADCRCPVTSLQGLEPSVHNSQLYLHNVYVSQAADCIIAIQVQQGQKGRTKVKVSGIIVSEETGEIRGGQKTGEVVELVHTIALQTGGAFDVRNKKVAKPTKRRTEKKPEEAAAPAPT